MEKGKKYHIDFHNGLDRVAVYEGKKTLTKGIVQLYYFSDGGHIFPVYPGSVKAMRAV